MTDTDSDGRQSYRLLLLNGVPVSEPTRGQYHTSDLWARDLEAQNEVVGELCVVAPTEQPNAGRSAAIPSDVRVVEYAAVSTRRALLDLVAQYDVVQVGVSRPRWRSRWMFRLLRAATELRRCIIVGISSNRAKAVILNARSASALRRVRSGLVAGSVLRTQRAAARRADGLSLTGHGLEDVLGVTHPNTFVNTASWIREQDVVSAEELERRAERALERGRLRACVAARLDPMKGVHLAVEATRLLRDRMGDRAPTLSILGQGPEEDRLRSLVEKLELEDVVEFRGVFAYPDKFLHEINGYDLMLLTNLSDEQPRLVFDAASQGVVTITPDSRPYQMLHIDRERMYPRGDVSALATRIEKLSSPDVLAAAVRGARAFALSHTIRAMHAKRARWIQGTLDQRSLA